MLFMLLVESGIKYLYLEEHFLFWQMALPNFSTSLLMIYFFLNNRHGNTKREV